MHVWAMQVLEQEAADKAASEKKFPDFQPGDILELKLVRSTDLPYYQSIFK